MKFQKLWCILGSMLMTSLCVGFSSCTSQSSPHESFSSDADEYVEENIDKEEGDDYSWLIGSWKCTTEYGTAYLVISETTATYSFLDDVEEGSYEVINNKFYLHCHTPSGQSYNTTMELDCVNQRIDMGEGHWMSKQ